MKQRLFSYEAVGRAGHDPATYGLKGRANESESSGVVDEHETREPTVVQADAIVEVTSGLRKAQRGRVLEIRPTAFFGTPDVSVQFEDGMVRTIRADYLRRIA